MQNGEMGDREASVFHRYTAYLAQRAGGMVLRWTIVGGVLGGLLGSITLSGWAHWPVSHGQAYFVALLGAVSGSFLGRAVGSGRAQMILFQAQLAQHQHDFERKLLAVSAAVQAQPAALQSEPQPEPQAQAEPQVHAVPEAVQEPAPAPPAPVEPEAEPVYLPDPGLALSHEFALPELPELPPLPDPEPAFVAEPVAVEPEPEPVAFVPEPAPIVPEPVAFAPEPELRPESADVVPFAPRPEGPAVDVQPAPFSEPLAAAGFAASPLAPPTFASVPSVASLGIPPVSGESHAPAVSEPPAASGADGDPGWWRPDVNER